MLVNKTENTDLLSLLSGKTAGAGENAGAAGEFAALLEGAKGDGDQELLKLLAKQQSEGKVDPELLQKMLQSKSAEGEAVEIDPEQLAKKLEEGSDEDAINQLLKKPQGNGKNTSMIKKQMVKNQPADLENVEIKQPELLQVTPKQAPKVAAHKGKVAAAQNSDDFLKNMAMVNKNQIAMMDGDQPVVKKLGKGFQKYKTESKALKSNLIEFPKAQAEQPIGAQTATPVMAAAMMGEHGKSSNELMGGDAGDSKKAEAANSHNKVLDLSHVKASNSEQLVEKISNYIQQSYVQNKGELDVTVHHNELGQFKVNAKKAGAGQQVDLEITTATKDGKAFFSQHEPELIRSLTNSGVKLSNFKVVNNHGIGLESGMMSDNKGQQQGSMNFGSGRGQQQFQGGQHGNDQAHQDSQRRRQLWDQMQQQQQYAS